MAVDGRAVGNIFSFRVLSGDTEFRPTFFRSILQFCPYKSWPKSVNFFFYSLPKKQKIPPSKVVQFYKTFIFALEVLVSKGVFIHKITSEGWQTIREGRARLWEP